MTREELFQSSLDQLEFYRVLESVAGFAASSLGAEQIREATPLTDADEIQRQHGIVSELRILIQRDAFPPLDGIYDVREALAYSRLPGAFLSGENFLHILTTLQALRKVREFFSSRRETAPVLAEYTSDIHVNRLFERHIQDAIDDTGNVRDNASRDLQRIRREIIDRSAALRDRLQKILRRVAEDELVTDEYVTLREGRLVLPMRTEFKRKVPGIIHGESQTGNTVYLEPAEIFDMNNEIAELTFAERREVERILRTLTEELGSEANLFIESLTKLQLVDSGAARARYAEKYNCGTPVVTEDDRIHLVNARHPILLTRLEKVVPMSLDLDREQRCIVVSGPNAGGKTVAMKTLGLIAMMALSGMHPPADECIVHPCAVFTDIGDQQSVENDLSTFSSHMTRIGEVVRNVMIGDIVLLDEVGTGTDPDEGGAIAAAILEELLRRCAFIVATTHHSYLKIFAYETDAVVNAGMEFDTKTITPTYHLMIGMPGNSYAFELLERFGFEQKILSGAKGKLGEERNRMTEIIKQLEETLAETRTMSDEHRRQRDAAEVLRTKLEADTREYSERKRTILNDAREEARQTLANANSLIENTLREIRSGAANDQVREMRRSVEEARGQLKPIEDRSNDGSKGFQKGDTVRLKGGAQIGELEFEPDEKGNVVVMFGSLRMRSHVDDLETVAKRDIPKQEAGRTTVLNAEPTESKLDLRGMYGDEAVVRVEQALTAAINSHYNTLEIIHGKGTGALRRKIHEYLTSHPNIASFRLGTLTEGGAGVTIVELK